jgi:hypothetical protein
MTWKMVVEEEVAVAVVVAVAVAVAAAVVASNEWAEYHSNYFSI